MMKPSTCGLLMVIFLLGGACSQSDEWIPLFDGKTLQGWKASENTDSFRVESGTIVTDGLRSHLFYVGDVQGGTFKNFELELEVKTTPGSNSGIYFHTNYQDSGWPSKGYEAQILNSHSTVRRLTGSLYAVRNVWKTPVRDNDWFKYQILVQGATIQIRIDDELMVDYTEPGEPHRTESLKGRILSSGTFALQCHDPESKVFFRDIRVKSLPDNLPSLGEPPADVKLNAKFVELAGKNIPLIDLHVHLKQGLTMEQALANSRLYGTTYGIAVNCGLDMTLPDEQSLRAFLRTNRKPPHTYLAMQAEGREWLDLFSRESISQFDYVFTDSMTWSNDDGKRMRLWVKDEVEVGEPQHFMEMLVDRTVGILSHEPIDIYVNPTYLPEEIAHRYDELWTQERMDRVIGALVENKVALEINASRRLPSPAFIKRAKAAGVRFSFGTNNGGPNDLGQMEYCLEMIDECTLESEDMWVPGDPY